MYDTRIVFRVNKKREFKDKKFGFGGQKKRSKYNTKKSFGDSSDFNVKKHSTVPGKGKKGGAKVRENYIHISFTLI